MVENWEMAEAAQQLNSIPNCPGNSSPLAVGKRS